MSKPKPKKADLEKEIAEAQRKANKLHEEAEAAQKRLEYLELQQLAEEGLAARQNRTHMLATIGGVADAVGLFRFWGRPGQDFDVRHPEDARFRDLMAGVLLEVSERLGTMTQAERDRLAEDGGTFIAMRKDERPVPTEMGR